MGTSNASRARTGPLPRPDTGTEPSAAHTPGNHKVEMSLYQGYSSCVYVDTPNGSMKTLAEVRNYRDALLYAAAPDLLEALKGAIGALEFSQDYHRDLGNEEQAFVADRLDAALAAIDKAEGRS